MWGVPPGFGAAGTYFYPTVTPDLASTSQTWLQCRAWKASMPPWRRLHRLGGNGEERQDLSGNGRDEADGVVLQVQTFVPSCAPAP